MRWLRRLLGTVLAVLLIVLGALWLSLQWSVSAAWVLSQGLGGLWSVPVQAQGEVKVDLWPQIRLQVETLHLCGQNRSVCAQLEQVASIHEVHAADVEFVSTWGGLLDRDIQVNWLGLGALDVLVGDAHHVSRQTQTSAQRQQHNGFTWFQDGLVNRSVSLDAADLRNIQIRSIQQSSEAEPLIAARRLRLMIQADPDSQATDLNMIFDDVRIETPFVQQWDLASMTALFAQTLRADLTVEDNVVQIGQIDLIGGNVQAEDFKGWANLQDQTLSLQFKLDAELLNQSTSASGFQIQLRERTLPVQISGSWNQPSVQAGESARALPSETDQ
ncbi:hypothetical protein [Orrella sp. 11846]|uniref:hypothetical protein n=1 Tax=Orrella sp. 11846 TaxID=3409913 RepID=UPI003B5A9B1D